MVLTFTELKRTLATYRNGIDKVKYLHKILTERGVGSRSSQRIVRLFSRTLQVEANKLIKAGRDEDAAELFMHVDKALQGARHLFSKGAYGASAALFERGGKHFDRGVALVKARQFAAAFNAFHKAGKHKEGARHLLAARRHTMAVGLLYRGGLKTEAVELAARFGHKGLADTLRKRE